MITRRQIAALAAVLALAGTLTFPSGAAVLLDGPTDELGNDVELAPSSDYAHLDDGELVVDISASNPNLDAEGLNPDSVTTFDDLFRVQYTGSEYADVWLTHDSSAVTFSVDGEPIQSEANNVTLAPNESVAVGMAVNTSVAGADGIVDDITIHAKAAGTDGDGDGAGDGAGDGDGEAERFELEFDGPTVQSRAPTEHSRRFTVLGAGSGSVYTFDANGLVLDRAANAPLRLEEVVVGNDDGSLSMAVEAVAGDSSRTLVTDAGPEPLGVARVDVETGRVSNATLRFSAAEEYLAARDASVDALAVYRDDDGDLSELDVSVTDRRNGRVYFEADTPGFSSFVVAADRARLGVTDAALDKPTVQPGESVAVSATVANDGTLAGERRIEVTVGDAVVAERTVRVGAGDTTTVTVPVARNDTGEYRVAVDGVDAGSFVVEPADAPVAGTSPQPQDDQAGADDEQSGPEDVSTPESVAEEPAGFGLTDLFGLVTLLGLLAATLFLARRVPWR